MSKRRKRTADDPLKHREQYPRISDILALRHRARIYDRYSVSIEQGNPNGVVDVYHSDAFTLVIINHSQGHFPGVVKRCTHDEPEYNRGLYIAAMRALEAFCSFYDVRRKEKEVV